MIAIHRNEAIEVRYQSLFQPAPSCCWIAPHTIGIHEFRWYTRAFCIPATNFKDFLLSRILDTHASKPSRKSNLAETNWHKEASLEIRSHPELSKSQKKIIARHYGMLGGHTKKKVRKVRLDYALHRPGLVTNSSARYPQNQQITLLYKAGILQ